MEIFSKEKHLFVLILIIDILVLFAALFGILDQNIYLSRHNSITLYEILGQDIITLIVSLLLLIIIIFNKKKETILKIIICLGFLSYIIYLYAYICFGVISNTFYIIDLLILGLSVYCFIILLVKLGKNDSVISANSHYPAKSISIFFIIIILIVGSMEIKNIIMKTIIQNVSIIPKDIFLILDLCFLFPAMIMTSILNLKKIIFGYLLTGIFLVKTITLMPAIIVSDVIYWINKGTFIDFSFDIIATVIIVVSIFFFFLYHRGIKKE